MDFLSYALSLSPSVLSIPRLGHLNTLDGYNRAVTVAGSSSWSSSFNGMSFNPVANGRYSIAHGAEQFFTDQTVFIHFSKPYESTSTTQFTACKVDGLGTTWLFAISSNYLYLYNSAITSQNAGSGGKPMIGYTSCAFKSVGSSAINFYQDGTLVDVNAGLDFSTQYASPITVGSYYTGGNQLKGTSIDCVAIFPSALSDETISNLHTSFDQLIVAPEPKTTYFIPEKDTKGAVIDIHGEPNANNIISDKSGNGNNGTISGSLGLISDSDVFIYDSPGQSNGMITIQSNSSINDKFNYTLVMDLHKRSNGAAGGGRFFDKVRIQSYTNAHVEQYSGGYATWIHNLPLARGLYTVKHDRNNPATSPEMTFNGTPLNVSVLVGATGTAVSDVGNDLILMNRASQDRSGDCTVGQFKMYPTELSADDLRDEYVKFATRYYRNLTPRFEHPVMFSAASAIDRVGPYTQHSSTGQWLDDGTDRYLEFTTNSAWAYIRNPNSAYGAWCFEIYKGSGTTYTITRFISNNGKVSYNSDLSYSFVIAPGGQLQLIRVSAPLVVSGAGYVPTTGRIKVFITRRVIDSTFTVWTKEANHPSWTQWNTATDATYTSGSYFTPEAKLGTSEVTRVYNPIYWPYGDSLTPDDVDFI